MNEAQYQIEKLITTTAGKYVGSHIGKPKYQGIYLIALPLGGRGAGKYQLMSVWVADTVCKKGGGMQKKGEEGTGKGEVEKMNTVYAKWGIKEAKWSKVE
jgi:hypothetical protein